MTFLHVSLGVAVVIFFGVAIAALRGHYKLKHEFKEKDEVHRTGPIPWD